MTTTINILEMKRWGSSGFISRIVARFKPKTWYVYDAYYFDLEGLVE